MEVLAEDQGTYRPPVDVTAPLLKEVTAVSLRTNDTSPSYIFSSSEDGLISYEGLCSSSLSIASKGNNPLNFMTRGDGSYADCEVHVTDADGYTGSLSASDFFIDTVSPVISELIPVPSRTNDPAPSYTFHSSEAGVISYSGSCSSSDSTANKGSNTITFATLASGNRPTMKHRYRSPRILW